MMKRLTGVAVLAAVLAFSALNPVHAVEIEGVKLADSQSFGGQNLVLNGYGLRTKFGFKVYTAGLYVPKKAETTADVLAQKGPKRLMATMLREISSRELGDLLIEALRKNATREEMSKIGLSLVRVGEVFGAQPSLKKGDTFGVDYTPGKGTVIMINGKPMTDPLPEEEFANAMYKIWLGDKPADSSLKAQLLGAKPAVQAPREPN
jgi:hypothetical protein